MNKKKLRKLEMKARYLKRKRDAQICSSLAAEFGSEPILPLPDKFGCADARADLPAYVHQFLANTALLQNVIGVPIRRNCFSASGQKLECHSNVLNLVHVYGGSRIGGFAVVVNDEDNSTYFQSHSVWCTPEGKAVCVTAANYPMGLTHVPFIPLVNEERWVTAHDNFFVQENKPGRIEIHGSTLYGTTIKATRNSACETLIRVAKAEQVPFEHDAVYLKKPYFIPNLLVRRRSVDDAQHKEDLCDGGFNLPSKWNCKTWSEIRAEFMRMFPQKLQRRPRIRGKSRVQLLAS